MPKEQTPFFKRLFRSKLLIVFEIVVLVVFSSALAKEIIRKHQIEGEVKKLQEELTQLEQNNIELSGLIQYFNSDTFKEEQARLKLGLQKPGESVIAVLGESTGTATEEGGQLIALAQKSEGEQLSNPQRWWNYFFKISTEKMNNDIIINK